MSENEIATGNVENNDDLDAFTSEFLGGKKEDKPDANQEAEQEVEVSGDQGEDQSQKTDEPELTDEDEAEAEKEAAKPKSKVQERIDELVKKAHEVERAAAARETKMREEFEAKLAALSAPKVATATEAEPTADALNEDGSEKYPLGEFDPSFIKDLTRFTLNQERAQAAVRDEQARQTRERDVQAQTLKTAWDQKVEASKTNYPDFQEKGAALLSNFDNLNPEYANYIGTVLMSMDHGPDVLYYLSNHPDEATTIVNSGAQKATLALGRIEAKFIEADATKQLAKPIVTKAPAPPGSATARGTGGSQPTVPADTEDLKAFEREFFRKKR